MKKRISYLLLKGCNLSEEDAARLVLEAIEKMGSADGKNRLALMCRLRRIIELGVEALKNEEATVSFEHAAWASVEMRKDRRPSTLRDLRHFVRRMLRVEGVSMRPIRAMNTKECRDLLCKAFGNSVHSYRKGRAILHSIFTYAYRQEWCDDNPVNRIEVPKVKETTIEPLKPEQVERLTKMAMLPKHNPMRFSLYLMLYCGVRPTEISRIEPERDVLWEQKCIVIRSSTSKTGGGRVIPLRNMGGLTPDTCVIPSNWLKRWRLLRRDAGFSKWQSDCLRHTFASYHAYCYKDLPMLQMEMGHRDCHLLRTRYILPVSEADARKFWKLKVI